MLASKSCSKIFFQTLNVFTVIKNQRHDWLRANRHISTIFFSIKKVKDLFTLTGNRCEQHQHHSNQRVHFFSVLCLLSSDPPAGTFSSNSVFNCFLTAISADVNPPAAGDETHTHTHKCGANSNRFKMGSGCCVITMQDLFRILKRVYSYKDWCLNVKLLVRKWLVKIVTLYLSSSKNWFYSSTSSTSGLVLIGLSSDHI